MEKGFRTEILHSGESEFAKKIAQSVSVPKVVPIYMSSVFSFDDVPSLDGVYAGTEKGYVYSRMANPGVDSLNDVLTTADNCGGTIAFSSGMAAIIASIISNVKSGDHIISSPVLYGGVYDYLKNEITRFGVEVDFVDFIHDDFEKYIKPNTKIIYTETITNPLMEVMDLKAISEKAHKHGLKLIVDNTFATPAICRPMDFGADIVVYSGTKYLNGHSDIICGVIASDEENIANIQKYATLYGSIISPFDAWILTRSMRTLELRMRQHSENALALAKYFEGHPKVERVYYPGLPSSEFYEVGKKQFNNGWCGGMVSADIKGGEKGASDFIAACETVKFVPSLAGVTTSISYPAKTSHRAYSPEELKHSGISMGQLRFSTGLENIEDIIREFDKAFEAVQA
ncbi:cystathionine gamma-synthase [Anaerosphaera aminiphila DSM 21120]|uniref:homocysteine desulfhydrase n=1 Tax=Anaerosphaera aminiphila DSM 21120 TaxID=1120995 RepID=A0A1M5QS97_9FIRM|nr:aminotransferase class I/II-fold pyridoxal phosphate-dependent enzyme [Anaerosphaera aminiphila]SHH16962.1 cystathionine gamma-synthase [Anaerosphaera aminiphila DSM 21120]